MCLGNRAIAGFCLNITTVSPPPPLPVTILSSLPLRSTSAVVVRQMLTLSNGWKVSAAACFHSLHNPGVLLGTHALFLSPQGWNVDRAWRRNGGGPFAIRLGLVDADFCRPICRFWRRWLDNMLGKGNREKNV